MLIAHYPLNGDATDYFGNGGTSTNVTWVDGKIGQAGSFNGTSSSIDTGYKISDFIGDISICGWIKCNDLSERNPLVGADTSGVKPQVSIDGVENSVNATFNNDTNKYYVSSSAYSYVLSKPANSYTHVCATYRDEVPKLYVDGNEYTIALIGTGGSPDQNTPITIGKGFRAGTTQYAKAVIDDVRIYNHALSEKEVSNISNARNLNLVVSSDGTAVNTDAPNIITTMGTVTISADTVVGEKSFYFDGASKLIIDDGFQFDNVLGTTSNKASFFCWCKPTVLGTSEASHSVRNLLVAKASGGDNDNLEFGLSSSGGVDLYIDSDAASETNQDIGSGVTLNEWNFVGFTYNAGSVTVYINGSTFSSTFSGNFFDEAVGSELTLGQSRVTTGSFTGYMVGIQLFANELSIEYLDSVYKTGLSIDNIGNMHSKHFKEGFPYLSPANSATNNWPVLTEGGFNDTSGESDPCSGALTFEDAVAHAEAQGGRLPTKEEMENDATAGGGCGYDADLCWTCTKGVDDSEHWVVIGRSTQSGTPEIRNNSSTAFVRFVADDDLNRPNPVYISDSVIQNELSINANKIEYSTTKHNQFSEVGISRGLVSWLPLIGDTKDRVTNDVATNNGATPVGDGYQFDGVDDYITLPNLALSDSTLMGWVNSKQASSSTGSSAGTIIGYYGGGSNKYLLISIDGSEFRWTIDDGTNSFAEVATSNFNINQWYHIAITYNSDGTTVAYLDSIVVGSLTSSTNVIFDSLPYNIAKNGSVYFNGVVSNHRIYNRALTPEEIAQEYNSGKASLNKNSAFAKEFIEV